MKKILEKKHDRLPETLSVSMKEINKWWDWWGIWRAMERKPTEFIAALTLPRSMLSTFLELDSDYAILEQEQIKQDAQESKRRGK